MRFQRFAHAGTTGWGVVDDGTLYGLGGLADGPTVGDLADPEFRRDVRRRLETDGLPALPGEDVRPLAPVPRPGKVVCIGLNYRDHAEEQDEPIPEKPLLFGKASTAVTDPGAPVVHPPDIEQVDYEVELGVVVGRRASDVDAADAREYVAGYTVVNDVSARDAQFDDGQFFRGKSYDTFAPMGPALATGEDIDPNALDVSLSVNGEVKQDSNTEQFVFDVDELVEYVSRAMTLRPGDVISTGTPGGVGIFRDPPDLLSPGDVVEAEIESIGTLRNPVVGSGDRPA